MEDVISCSIQITRDEDYAKILQVFYIYQPVQITIKVLLFAFLSQKNLNPIRTVIINPAVIKTITISTGNQIF